MLEFLFYLKPCKAHPRVDSGCGGGLLPVDVAAVFGHEPVQLLLGDAGDPVLHVFTFHSGKLLFVGRPRFDNAVLRLHPVVGRVRTALCDGTVCRD